ncbi:glycosyltransferase [Clostridium uliginosum]|uniref:Glycosyltransferase involved in cell wall bisynthesis n=1 Tax=Clostridium uliginosum TaxID=119641 RepID=A0A1I1R7X6_9CLOT|nr:glycosyltransferase [Clostridium uliginosum]SFD26420.1 Glycosyltransferase involved in cell wall bisynthesis [Clostridium uliginosum]
MSKKAWLVTHDNYIDRRIFFFADVLELSGYEVTLFPSYFFDLLSDGDPYYVNRPVNKNIVKRYEISEDLIFEECREVIKLTQEKQEEFKKLNGRYAKNFREINFNISRYKKNHSILNGYNEFYIIQVRKGDKCVLYTSFDDKYSICYDTKNTLKHFEFENAIAQYMNEHTEFLGTTYSIGNINVKSELNEFGENTFYAQNPAFNSMYCYNTYDKTFEEITAIPFGAYNADEIKGKQFEFSEYKKIVYDYSPILENVKRQLEIETPDLVYVADLPTLPIGTMLKEVTGCKLIIDCHEWWYKQAKLWDSSFRRKIELSELYEKELYPKCDLCITVGEYLATDMSKCYEKPFETIYSCMSADLSVKPEDYNENIWNEMFGITAGMKIAVFQGSMTTLRNLDNLARATKYLDDNQYLIIVGGGPYETEFKKILQNEGNPERVRFTGWVNQKELMKYTVNADLGVLPYSAMDEYFSYSVPNKLMEYFEATVPMLFDVSMKEISMVAGENNVGVGADLSNPEIFGKKMKELLNSQDMLNKLKKNYELCKDKFRFENQKKQFENLLDKYI